MSNKRNAIGKKRRTTNRKDGVGRKRMVRITQDVGNMETQASEENAIISSDVQSSYGRPPSYDTNNGYAQQGGRSLPVYDLINDEPPPYEEEQHGVPIESIIKQIIEEYLQNVCVSLLLISWRLFDIFIVIIGIVFYNDCTAAPTLTIYLIGIGILSLVSKMRIPDVYRKYAHVATLFMWLFYLAGCVGVYKTIYIRSSDQTTGNYCHPLVFYLWLTIAGTLGVLICIHVIGVCSVCIIAYHQSKHSTRAPLRSV